MEESSVLVVGDGTTRGAGRQGSYSSSSAVVDSAELVNVFVGDVLRLAGSKR